MFSSERLGTDLDVGFVCDVRPCSCILHQGNLALHTLSVFGHLFFRCGSGFAMVAS